MLWAFLRTGSGRNSGNSFANSITMTRLSVNINKIATLRNARGGGIPDVVKAAAECERFGADGITVHPRPDERHIRRKDVYEIAKVIRVEFNIEGYPSNEFLDLIRGVRPAQATLVPDPPEVLTSNAGWNTIGKKAFLQEVVGQIREMGIRVSLFTDSRPEIIEGAKETGADRIELYTEPYAAEFSSNPEKAVKPFREAAILAQKLGLGLNAGHDLNLENLAFLRKNLPGLLEVSIGHALIADALYLGLEKTIHRYKEELRKD